MADSKGRLQLFLLAISSGLLLGAAYPPIPFPITACIGFVPFLAMMERTRSMAQAFRYSYVTFLILNLTTVWWISGWWGSDPWLKAAGVATNFVHPLFFTVPAMLYYRLRRTQGDRAALFLFPFLWTTYEWAFQLPELSFPWLPIGNTLTYAIRQIQFIEYTGMFGASFLLALINVLAWIAYRNGRQMQVARNRRTMRTALALLFSLVLIVTIHSHLILRSTRSDPEIRVGIAQPNIDPYDKWSEGETPLDKVKNLMSLYDTIALHGAPDLIVFPETAFPFYLLQASNQREWDYIRRKVDSTGIALLTGFADLVWYDHDAPPSARRVKGTDYRYATFNASILIEPHKSGRQIYHKSRLTPLSERIPYVDTFPFLADLLGWGVGISSWGLDNDTTVFDLQTPGHSVRTWAMICYETLYPEFVSGFVHRGANVLGVISNDGWFGNSSGPYQLQQYAALRAIENRRSIYRCANNGISCFIDPYGRVSQQTAFGTRAWIVGSVALRTDETLYSRYGDWFAHGCTILTLVGLAIGEFQSLKKRRKDDRSPK